MDICIEKFAAISWLRCEPPAISYLTYQLREESAATLSLKVDSATIPQLKGESVQLHNSKKSPQPRNSKDSLQMLASCYS